MRTFVNFFEKSLAFDKQYKGAHFIYLSDHSWVTTRMQYLVRCYMPTNCPQGHS